MAQIGFVNGTVSLTCDQLQYCQPCCAQCKVPFHSFNANHRKLWWQSPRKGTLPLYLVQKFVMKETPFWEGSRNLIIEMIKWFPPSRRLVWETGTTRKRKATNKDFVTNQCLSLISNEQKFRLFTRENFSALVTGCHKNLKDKDKWKYIHIVAKKHHAWLLSKSH